MNIILAHGILGFDRIGRLEYFNGIKAYLEGKYEGVKVLTTEVSATGSIEMRGKQLRTQVLEAFGNNEQPPVLNPEEKAHIIAHSMGGLDSRYMLSPDNADNETIDAAKLISSLTTVGTPHKGSPIADLLSLPLDGRARFKASTFLEGQVIASLALLGISNQGLRDLTTPKMADFNASYRDSDRVRYFWTTGIGRSTASATSVPFLPLHEYLSLIGKSEDETISDGVVPLASARREEAGWEPVGSLWDADHADEVGHDLDKYLSPRGIITALAIALRHEPHMAPPPARILTKYDEIIARVSSL